MTPFSDQPPGQTVMPCQQAAEPEHWIEIELVGEDDKPIPDAAYRMQLPDGSEAEGYLDENGFARVEHIVPGGMCQLQFPELDGEAWQFLETLSQRAEE